MGCFWGAERKFWKARRRVHDRGRLRRRLHAEPHVRRGVLGSHRPHRGRARRVRSEADVVRRHAARLLGEPRPDAGHAAGQRRRDAVPLEHLHVRRRSRHARSKRRARCSSRGSMRRITARSRPRSHRRPTFYYAEDYHQQYLAKNPNGYCGLGGTGVSCPIGVARADSGYVQSRSASTRLL